MKAPKILKSNITPCTPTPAFGRGKATTPATPAAETVPPAEVEPPKPTKLKFKKEIIRLADVTFSTKHQAREETNKEALAEYTEVAKEAREKSADSPFPALKAVKRGEEIFVFSGFTRGAALKKAGYEETLFELADAPNISDAEIFRLAVEANQQHGARLTNADKRHNLLRAVKFPEFSGLSNNALTSIVGASEFFIRSHRPAATSGATRTSKAGKKINTKNIGKKGGKKPAASKTTAASTTAAATGGSADAPEIPGVDGAATTGGAATAVKNEASEKAIARIAKVLNGYQGYTAEGFRKGVEEQTIKVSAKDLEAWQATSDARIQKIAPLVIGLGWSPKKAFSHIDEEVTTKTRVDHLVNSAIASGGVLRKSPYLAPGEPVVDSKPWVVVVFDSTKFVVEVKEIKA